MDKVLLHAPIAEISTQDIRIALGGNVMRGYEVFTKLVQTEEAELSAPYDQ